MTEPLRVDAPLVRESGAKLELMAGEIPAPPPVFSPAGADALSTAIAGRVGEVVTPAVTALPVTKEELTRYAQNVLAAADTYDSTDRRLAEEILKRLGEFESAQGSGGAGLAPGGAAGAGAPRAAGAASTGAGTAGAPAAGGADQAGQLGQMMGMPMQMAQQAAQIPMQLAGMAAAIPQGIMQGVQSAMQQMGQLSDMAGTDDEQLDGEEAERQNESAEERPDEEQPEPTTSPDSQQAAPGHTGGERAPEPQRPEAQPTPPAAPKPAPTRPAEASPGIAL